MLRVVDPARRAAIGALFPAMPWIGEAPVFFVFLGDARRLRAGRRAARQAGRQRHAGRLLQRGGRRRAGDADLHPRRRVGRPRLLPDQRHPQSRRRDRGDLRAARQGVPGRRALRRLSGRARPRQHAPAAHASPCTATATTTRRSPQEIDAYDRARDCAPRHRARPAARARPVRLRRLLRLVGGQGAPGGEPGGRGVSGLSARAWFHLDSSGAGREPSAARRLRFITEPQRMLYPCIPEALSQSRSAALLGARVALAALVVVGSSSAPPQARRSTRSRSAATWSSPPKTTSGRSSSSRTASRPASTTRWSRR